MTTFNGGTVQFKDPIVTRGVRAPTLYASPVQQVPQRNMECRKLEVNPPGRQIKTPFTTVRK